MSLNFHRAKRHKRFRKPWSFILNLFALVACLGCRGPEEKHYPISLAEVVGVDVPHKLIIIKHGEIPGLMPAMTMSYTLVHPDQAKSLAPGDKISADLVVSENVGHLDKILLREKAKQVSPAPAPVLKP
jgi:Cu/Ag efflux protein CusF